MDADDALRVLDTSARAFIRGIFVNTISIPKSHVPVQPPPHTKKTTTNKLTDCFYSIDIHLLLWPGLSKLMSAD